MTRRPTTRLAAGAAFVALGVLALTGCNALKGSTTAAPSAAAPSASASASGAAPVSSSSAKAGSSAKPTPSGTKKNSGALPDICSLLTKLEVAQLTNAQVTQMSNEGGNSPDLRYCQWQLTKGQLDVTVNFDSRAGFEERNKQAVNQPGLGQAAYTLAGHLYVYNDGKVIDVYATSADTDDANLRVEKNTLFRVLPKLR
jgi:hypothetical protein